MENKKIAIMIIAVLLSSSAMAQKAITIDSSLSGQSATLSLYSISSVKRLEPSYNFISNTKPIMIVSDLKPDSTFHVWIDKKSITWTSDSTFILKQRSWKTYKK